MAVVIERNIVEILVKKIRGGEINPKTGEPYKIDDIKIQEYKEAVSALLTQQAEAGTQ